MNFTTKCNEIESRILWDSIVFASKNHNNNDHFRVLKSIFFYIINYEETEVAGSREAVKSCSKANFIVYCLQVYKYPRMIKYSASNQGSNQAQ